MIAPRGRDDSPAARSGIVIEEGRADKDAKLLTIFAIYSPKEILKLRASIVNLTTVP